MISEADRRAFVATRTPMTKEELDAAREVLCEFVEPETSVAYHYTMLLLEVERVQALAHAPDFSLSTPDEPHYGEPPDSKVTP